MSGTSTPDYLFAVRRAESSVNAHALQRLAALGVFAPPFRVAALLLSALARPDRFAVRAVQLDPLLFQ
jgi:hypothetical protein